MIDADSIIKSTVEVFEKSGALNRVLETVDADAYRALHTAFLVPLDIKIDVDTFLKELQPYQNYFEKWGKDFDLPRYGLALVNRSGVLHTPDVVNQSLMEWNKHNPDKPCLEIDFIDPTPALKVQSLKALRVFNGRWCRSNVFKLEKGAEFKPHIDTVVPSMWLRLWGTTNAEKTTVRLYDPVSKDMKRVEGIESGRIYLIDTSVVHDAYADDTVYQFFLSVKPSAYAIVSDLICK